MNTSSITTVLIIGEDLIDVSQLKHSLDPYGYQLFFSSTTMSDVENSLCQYHPEVVLIRIDPQAPNESLSLGHLFHKQGNLPFIYFSSYTHDETLSKAQRTHPYCYIIKPFDPVNLHTSIQCALYCFQKNKISNDFIEQLRTECDELKKRAFNMQSNSSTVNLCDYYQFKVHNFTLFYKNLEIKMTKKERALMTLLTAHFGNFVDFEQIIRFVWDGGCQTNNDIRTLVWRFNKKLPTAIIKNAAGIGYYLE